MITIKKETLNIFNNYLSGNKHDAICGVKALKSEHLVPFTKDMLLKVNDCNKTYYKDTFDAAIKLHEVALNEIECRLGVSPANLAKNRQTVLDEYPNAVVVKLVDFGYGIWKQATWCNGVLISKRCQLESEAWESAAHRLIC